MCQVHLHDLNDNSGMPLVIETGGIPLTAFAFSPSRQVMAFGDAAGVLFIFFHLVTLIFVAFPREYQCFPSGNTHLYADREDAVLNENAVQSEYADMMVRRGNRVMDD